MRINKWMDGWMERGKGGEGKEREEKGLKPPQSKFSGYVAVNDTTQQNNRTAAYGFSAFSMQITWNIYTVPQKSKPLDVW